VALCAWDGIAGVSSHSTPFEIVVPGLDWCREPFLEDLCVNFWCRWCAFCRLVELKKEYQEWTGGLDCCTFGTGRLGYTWKYANDSTEASILALAAFEAKTVPRWCTMSSGHLNNDLELSGMINVDTTTRVDCAHTNYWWNGFRSRSMVQKASSWQSPYQEQIPLLENGGHSNV
jgi:hypothetical protein